MELVAVQGAMSLIPGAAQAWNALRAEVYAKYGVSLFLSSPAGAWRSDAMVRDMYYNPAKYGATKGVAKPKSLGGPGSVHENGRCIDINNWAAVGLKNLEPIAARHQFVRTIPKEQWHFEYRGPEGGGGGGAVPVKKEYDMGKRIIRNSQDSVWNAYLLYDEGNLPPKPVGESDAGYWKSLGVPQWDATRDQFLLIVKYAQQEHAQSVALYQGKPTSGASGSLTTAEREAIAAEVIRQMKLPGN